MNDRELALAYAPIIHFDEAETIPLRAVGYTIAHNTMRSDSFPKRELTVPIGASCVIEYAYYWDYDIQHMYDLEHIWITVGEKGEVMDAEGSFHGRYLKLLPALSCVIPPEKGHVHAFCQQGKHAFMPDGQLFRLLPDWKEACSTQAGGPVLIGGPFGGVYQPTEEDNALSRRYIRETLRFMPTMRFTKTVDDFIADAPVYLPWLQLKEEIPVRIRRECDRLHTLYAERDAGDRL